MCPRGVSDVSRGMWDVSRGMWDVSLGNLAGVPWECGRCPLGMWNVSPGNGDCVPLEARDVRPAGWINPCCCTYLSHLKRQASHE
jgi:hypothetical protein